MELTVEKLKSAYPEMYQSIVDEAYERGLADGTSKGLAEGTKSGAENERTRIKGVEESLLPGHEALVAEMKFDGVTTPEQAAVKILHAEKSLRETKLESFKMDSPPAVPVIDPAKDEKKKIEHQAGTPMTPEQIKQEWDSNAAIRAEYGDNFAAYEAFMEAEQKGLIKIYKGGK